MASICKRCGLHVPDGISTCSMCGGTVSAAEPPPTSNSALPSSKSTPVPSKWLIFIGISLVVAPLVRLNAIVSSEIPRLYGEQFQPFLDSHPGYSNLLYFRIVMNSLLILASLCLNFLLYTKRKHFPSIMIAYVATTFVFLIADTGAVNYLFPDASTGRGFIPLLRYFIWAGTLIPYLLTSEQIKSRFDR
jgi:Protein of unknown function (DUF2569)